MGAFVLHFTSLHANPSDSAVQQHYISEEANVAFSLIDRRP